MTGQQKDFINNRLNPLLEEIVKSLLEAKPSDPVSFMISWLQERLGVDANFSEKEELRILRQEVARLKQMGEIGSEEEKSDSEEDEIDDEEIFKKVKKEARAAVSAEAYGQWNKKEDFVPRVIEKTAEQKERILNILSSSFMFSSLESSEKQIVIDAMEFREVDANTMVITQGEDGNELFVVEEGRLRCFKQTGEEERFFKNYNAGECFGELALLYNAPRAACIKAETYCKLLSLDRECFNHIVKDAAIRRRQTYEELLAKISLLENMDPYERSQLADALKAEEFQEGQFVIREGEEGDKFFMVIDGKAKATKVINQGEQAQTVKEYADGDYFGELALIKNEPRAANIIAVTHIKLISLDRHSFKRLLGPIEGILNRNAEKYEEILNSLRNA